MKSFINLLVSLLHIGGICQVSGTTYYVAPDGSDNNSGTNIKLPWQTLAKVNSASFRPGNKIVFKAGGVWVGHLNVTSSGKKGKPIIYGRYGKGNRPIIMATINEQWTVWIWDKEYVEVHDLEITSNMFKHDGIKARSGILIANSTDSTKRHVYIKNCEVHHIYTSPTGPDVGKYQDNRRGTGGITITSWDKAKGFVAFDDLLIENNYIHDVSQGGIYQCQMNMVVEGAYKWDENPTTRSTRCVFRNNIIRNCTGDALVANGIQGALIDHNEVDNTPCVIKVAAYAAIWTAYSDDVLVQHNEVYNIKMPYYDDGSAFDNDLGANGTIFQYNYAHDVQPGTFFDMGPGTSGVFRYNISRNSPVTTNNQSTALECYNNVWYIEPGLDVPVRGGTGEVNNRPIIMNNIFVNHGTIPWDFALLPETDFCCYHGNIVNTKDKHSIQADPQFSNPLHAGIDPHTCDGFRLKPASPCHKTGKIVTSNAPRDFFGNPLAAHAATMGVDNRSQSTKVIWTTPQSIDVPAVRKDVVATVNGDPVTIDEFELVLKNKYRTEAVRRFMQNSSPVLDQGFWMAVVNCETPTAYAKKRRWRN